MFLISELFSKSPERIAALDLGSNSFHMIIAHVTPDGLKIIDRMKEPVRLGFGLQDDGQLSAEAGERALACLARFGERLKGFPAGTVRAVGTKTLRAIDDQGEFLAKAKRALGYDIEIVSGTEEARLVYLGVAHGLAGFSGQRLVIDIGGGSTELILGNEMQDGFKESLSMGCVSISKQFFAQGTINNKNIRAALTYCRQQLDPLVPELHNQGWQHSLGASGTMKSVAKVIFENGWADQECITPEGLEQIIAHGLDKGQLDKLSLKGLSPDRLPVFFAGVMVVKALFDGLGLNRLFPSPFALREGLIYDFLGRITGQDIRQSSVQQLSKRFHVDLAQASRVSLSAEALLQQVGDSWQLQGEAQQWLNWACQLFEIGLDISHHQFHKHSAYIAEHSDLAGFSQADQTQMASILLASRKKFTNKYFKGPNSEGLLRLAVLLRLAIILNRARKAQEQHLPFLVANGQQLQLIFPQQYLSLFPLLEADLLQEQQWLQPEIELIISPSPNEPVAANDQS